MLFQEEHIEQIRAGEKTVTRRDWERKQVVEGNTYIASTEMFTSHDEADCYIKVSDVSRVRLGDISEHDAEAEGGYTVEEFRDVWRELHGEWNPDQTVYRIAFTYVGHTPPDERECANCGSEGLLHPFIADYDARCPECKYLTDLRDGTVIEI